MVRLVSGKPPKLDGVEGGSATPSSTPTPKVSTWDQVEERQQKNRGVAAAPKPPRPVPSIPDAGKTPPTGAPKPVVTGEMPGVGNILGRAATRTTYIPDDTGKPFPYKGQIRPYQPPVSAGRGTPVLTPSQKIAAAVNSTARGVSVLGNVNPFSGAGRGGTKGARIAALSTLMTSIVAAGGANLQQKQEVAKYFESEGYPKDAADTMANTYIATATGLQTGTSLAAEAGSDASFMAAGAAGGALIGAAFFGIGAGPGIVAGAAAGWAASRVVAGASALLNMVEAALSINSAVQGGDMVNIPTLDDFWFHGGPNTVWKDASGNPTGLLGFSARQGAADISDGLATSAAFAAVGAQYPGRFLSDEQVLVEEERIKSGHYATSADVDPKYDDYKQFIQEGYFVFKDTQGNYKVDTKAVQQFLLDTVRLTQRDDLVSYLPPKKPVGDEFYKSQRLTDEMLAGMWDIQDFMP